MHYRAGTGVSPDGYSTGSWVCPGWDGEGCDYQAPEPEWQPLGTVDVKDTDFRREWLSG
jgi:hypothetical protein